MDEKQKTVSADDNQVQWEQLPDGWWAVDGHRVLRIDNKTGIMSIAANCPYQVDIPIAKDA